MPNSSDSSFQLIKEDENDINLKNSSSPISYYSNGYPKTVFNENIDKVPENQRGGESSSKNAHLEQEQERKRDDENDQEIKVKTEVGKSEVADDDEGLKTPTSLDQRIPVPTKCPPAPRKPRPPSPPPSSRKRKFSRRRNVVKLDFSRDVESFFSTIIQEDLTRKMKKSSGDDDDDAK